MASAFRYGQKVKVISGFYQGMTGTLLALIGSEEAVFPDYIVEFFIDKPNSFTAQLSAEVLSCQ